MPNPWFGSHSQRSPNPSILNFSVAWEIAALGVLFSATTESYRENDGQLAFLPDSREQGLAAHGSPRVFVGIHPRKT
jgi:hypothetical protein